jgi:hypothetical protein
MIAYEADSHVFWRLFPLSLPLTFETQRDSARPHCWKLVTASESILMATRREEEMHLWLNEIVKQRNTEDRSELGLDASTHPNAAVDPRTAERRRREQVRRLLVPLEESGASKRSGDKVNDEHIYSNVVVSTDSTSIGSNGNNSNNSKERVYDIMTTTIPLDNGAHRN